MGRSAPAEKAMHALFLRSREVGYRIRRNPRARQVLLKIEDESGLVVVLPRWFAARDVPALLEKNATWILRALQRREIRLAALAPAPGEPPGALFGGRMLPLRFVPEPGRFPPLVRIEEGNLVLRAPPPAPGGEGWRTLLEAWYRSQAHVRFPPRVAHWAALTGRGPRSLRLGDPKTRWGSCSPRGAVSLSWRLVLAPEEVLDYLIVHELCHMAHPDHSEAFWNHVGAFLPDYARQREWLRHNGTALRIPFFPAPEPETFLDTEPS